MISERELEEAISNLAFVATEMAQTYERAVSRRKPGSSGATKIPALEFNSHRRDIEAIVQQLRHGTAPEEARRQMYGIAEWRDE